MKAKQTTAPRPIAMNNSITPHSEILTMIRHNQDDCILKTPLAP